MVMELVLVLLWSLWPGRRTAHEQVPIGLSILWRHDNVDDWIDACGQINEQITHNIEYRNFVNGTNNFRCGDWQIADQKRHKYDEYHFEETTIFGCHATWIENWCARCVHRWRLSRCQTADGAATAGQRAASVPASFRTTNGRSVRSANLSAVFDWLKWEKEVLLNFRKSSNNFK